MALKIIYCLRLVASIIIWIMLFKEVLIQEIHLNNFQFQIKVLNIMNQTYFYSHMDLLHHYSIRVKVNSFIAFVLDARDYQILACLIFWVKLSIETFLLMEAFTHAAV